VAAPERLLGRPEATVYDLAVARGNSDELSAPAEPFCWRDEDCVELEQPSRYVGFHNLSATRNIKRKHESTVYRYEAIGAGQHFGAVILSDDEPVLRSLKPFVDGAETAIGGSRSAGYGAVRFENAKIVSDWHEYDKDEEPEEDVVVVTLLSDAILRDRAGELTTDLDSMLGWRHIRAFQGTRVVGGFNRKWGLPLPQFPALRAGSVFVYRAKEADPQALRQAEQEGIGDRRAEGFGRIAINWHTRATLQRRVVDAGAASVASPALTPGSHALAQQMADRLLRAILEQKLLQALAELRISDPPSNAQLACFRVALRRASQDTNGEHILDYLEGLNSRAKQQFERARIQNRRLSRWLQDGLEGGRIWRELLEPTPTPSVAGATADPTDKLKLDYILRLLDALFKVAARERPLGETK